jgi:hypothetical protein
VTLLGRFRVAREISFRFSADMTNPGHRIIDFKNPMLLFYVTCQMSFSMIVTRFPFRSLAVTVTSGPPIMKSL